MRLLLTITTLLLTLLVSGCYRPVPVNTLNLRQLQLLSQNTVRQASGGLNDLRYSNLKETATSLGARAGLAYRARQIDDMLDNEGKNLDRSFNFDGLILAHNIMPPVLVEGRDSLNLASGNSIRLADRTYRIIQQAHFVTAPPTWRTYIWMDFQKPKAPDPSLLPKNPRENRVWSYYIKVGWKQGIRQANAIYTANLNRLERDFKGMLLYRNMLTQNMVSAPFVAKTDLGVTSSSGEMRVNDQVLRITALPEMQTNSKTWNPVILKTWQKQLQKHANTPIYYK